MQIRLIGVILLATPLALLGCDLKENDTGIGSVATNTGDDGAGGGGPGGGPGGGGPGGTGGDDGGTDSGGTDGGTDGGTTEPDSAYGPENSWFHAMTSEVPEGLAGTGYRSGDIAYNFTLQDQFGEEVELYQFYGQVIVIDAFAEW